jgi:predicted nucleic acid-binding protein
MSAHTVRVRENRWEMVEKKAWDLSKKAESIIKPTDITDALFYMYIKKVTIEDIEIAKRTRKD